MCAPYRQEFIYQKMLTYKGVSSIQARVSSTASTGQPSLVSDGTRVAGSRSVSDGHRALLPTRVCVLLAALASAPDLDLNLLVTGFQESCSGPQSPSSAFWAFGERLRQCPAFPLPCSFRAVRALQAHLILLCFADTAFFFF